MSNPHLKAKINHSAAMLFWTFAAKHGFKHAATEVLRTKGACLFRQQDARKILKPFGIEKLPDDLLSTTLNMICQEAVEFMENERSLEGIVFAEDAMTGRSPSAATLDVTSVCVRPARIIGDERLERRGELCLRHPLPAVVFSKVRPRKSFIRVASTRRALGMEVPMFLGCAGCTPMPNRLFALSGIFHIPAPSREIGHRWGGVIQNSITPLKGVTVQVDEVTHQIDFDWSNGGKVFRSVGLIKRLIEWFSGNSGANRDY